MRYFLVALVGFVFVLASAYKESCPSPIFCQGKLLETVQMSGLFTDSKTFVDLKMKSSEREILDSFDELLNNTAGKPDRNDINEFVWENFENFTEMEEWTPRDYKRNPSFLDKIEDADVKSFAQKLIDIWPLLAKKIKSEVLEAPELFSLIPLKEGFIVPGGRFREFYYWDTYWIIKGLLWCEMFDTVKGMLNNFMSLVKRYGFVPNGARVYYLHRSQPPLLTLMVSDYVAATNDLAWLRDNIKTVEKEQQFWLSKRLATVTIKGVRHKLAQYNSDSDTPRPESFREDVETASHLNTPEEKARLYKSIKGAAESGWDFTSRWIVDSDGGNTGNLTSLRIQNIVPVDLNSFLCQAFRLLGQMYKKLNNPNRASVWLEKSKAWEKSIQALYDEEDGVWYDYDKVFCKPRKYFYPSNLTPLWAGSYPFAQGKRLGRNAVKYLRRLKVLTYPGGVPTSLLNTGQQWDFPSAWPPVEHLVILGLRNSGDDEAKKVAADLADKWLRSNMAGYRSSGAMFEKYSAVTVGGAGGGGEYEVQSGFGWSNGVDFDLIGTYYLGKSGT